MNDSHDNPIFDLPRLAGASLNPRKRWKATAEAMLDRSGMEHTADADVLVSYHALVLDRELAAIFTSRRTADEREVEARKTLNIWEQRVRQDVSDQRRAGGNSDGQPKVIALTFSRLDSAPAAAVDDARPRWFEMLRCIAEQFLPMGSKEIITEVLHEQSRWIDGELVTAFEAGRYQNAEAFFSELRRHLHTVIDRERAQGRLKRVTIADQMKEFADLFTRCAWNHFERDGIATLMRDGQRIIGVDFHSVTLADGSAITRRDLREKLRTGADLSERYWDARFTSARAIAQAQEEAQLSKANKERPFRYGSGPMTDDGRPLTR